MASKRFRRFLHQNVEALAMTAEVGYRSDGRGVVRVLADELESDSTTEGQYLTKAGAHEGDWDAGMDRLVSNYDPQTEFVCVILENGAVADIALVERPGAAL